MYICTCDAQRLLCKEKEKGKKKNDGMDSSSSAKPGLAGQTRKIIKAIISYVCTVLYVQVHYYYHSCLICY